MNNLVLIVHTEFHLLTSLSILSTCFCKYNRIEILICIPEKSQRFSFSFPATLEENIHIEKIFISSESTSSNDSLDYIEEKIFNKENKVEEVIFFNRLSLFAQYLIRKLSKTSIKVSLGPDGAAAYASSKRLSPRWSFQQFIKYNKFIYNNRKLEYGLHFPNLDYANQSHIERVYVQFPDLVSIGNEKTIVQYNLLSDFRSIEWSNFFFNFNINDYLDTNLKVFLFCNQPLDYLNEWNEKVLSFVNERMSDYKIVVKTHPSTPISHKTYFMESNYIHFIDNTIPIELFIANLKESIIASFWSTASLFDSKENRNVWLYPYLESNNAMYPYIGFLNKIPHIEYIGHLEKLNNSNAKF